MQSIRTARRLHRLITICGLALLLVGPPSARALPVDPAHFEGQCVATFGSCVTLGLWPIVDVLTVGYIVQPPAGGVATLEDPWVYFYQIFDLNNLHLERNLMSFFFEVSPLVTNETLPLLIFDVNTFTGLGGTSPAGGLDQIRTFTGDEGDLFGLPNPFYGVQWSGINVGGDATWASISFSSLLAPEWGDFYVAGVPLLGEILSGLFPHAFNTGQGFTPSNQSDGVGFFIPVPAGALPPGFELPPGGVVSTPATALLVALGLGLIALLSRREQRHSEL